MAALTTAQEYQLVREAIQTLTTTGASVVSVSVDGMSKTYQSSQMPLLQERERELANRMCTRNRRKRTISSFAGSSGDY